MPLKQFIIYEGASEDPMRQRMRLVDAETIEDAWRIPGVIAAQEYVEPNYQDPPDLNKLRRGMAVWPS